MKQRLSLILNKLPTKEDFKKLPSLPELLAGVALIGVLAYVVGVIVFHLVWAVGWVFDTGQGAGIVTDKNTYVLEVKRYHEITVDGRVYLVSQGMYADPNIGDHCDFTYRNFDVFSNWGSYTNRIKELSCEH